MKKSRKRALAFKGEITAFLAFIFVLMLSVVGALLESAAIQIEKNCKRADTVLALESTFAEYHRELLEQYELFARFGSSEEVLKNRLQYYGATDMAHTLERKELLTDDSGGPFYEQAVRYTKDWLGLEDLSFGKEYEFSSGSHLEEEEQGVLQNLQNLLEEEEASLPQEDNPLQSVQTLKKSNLLTLLVSNPEDLSNRTIHIEELPSERELKKGNYKEATENGASDKVFFIAYLTEHFSDKTANDEVGALAYEQEYLLGGKASDKENLEAVCKRILQIRMLTNYTYLMTDSTKQAEAEALAVTLCSLLALPEITVLAKQGILLAWAYGESIVDTRALLKNKKVPLIKTTDTWQLQLANLTKLGTADEVTGEKEVKNGLGYSDYLKGLLLLESRENLCMRSLDLIESNLHIKTDECITKAEIRSKVELRRGIQEIFTTKFGYQ